MFNIITDIFYIIAGIIATWVLFGIRKNTSKKNSVTEEYCAQLNVTLIVLNKIINSVEKGQEENNKVMRECIELAKRK